MSITQVTSGMPLSVVDKCAVAVRQILEGNARLNAWTEGRIKRAVILAIPRAIGTPSILVSTLPPTQIENIGCAEVVASIVVTCVWNEPWGFIEDDIGTGETAIVEIHRSIMANSLLKVPQFGEDRLVENFVGFRPQGAAQFFEKGNSTTIFQSTVAEWNVSLNRMTRDLESQV